MGDRESSTGSESELLDDCRVLQPFVTKYMGQGRSAAEAWEQVRREIGGISQFPWDELMVHASGVVTPRTKNG